jgi:Icc-related predicted phosphoesterase
MKIVCLSDFHGRKEYLDKFIDSIAGEKPDLIIFAGDIVKGLARGEEWLESKYRGWVPNKEKEEIKLEEKEDAELYRAFYNAFAELKIKMVIVPGNMDAPLKRFLDVFEKEAFPRGNIELVHARWIECCGYAIGGFGGEITESGREDFFVLQFPQADLFMKLTPAQGSKKRILLFHTPPLGHLDEDSGRHKGVKAIKKIIEEVSPVLAVFGHSHKSSGKDLIGTSLLINPGAMKEGNWAVVDLEKKEVRFNNVV